MLNYLIIYVIFLEIKVIRKKSPRKISSFLRLNFKSSLQECQYSHLSGIHDMKKIGIECPDLTIYARKNRDMLFFDKLQCFYSLEKMFVEYQK